ncbi:hypothetical protein DOTSEDRAFT_41716 [Dothistroma septosporum NZE10]|uniref:Uncharacterized protein n=1 Tax=Dothistroma septosporum (strain NZE10 / CBS 128990) TaxID=675120 RepID=N1PUW7_DOTSN|nr:hypothetical protein DOTSEDRAFT_41716 [Dothistroma septosporum NZE10]
MEGGQRDARPEAPPPSDGAPRRSVDSGSILDHAGIIDGERSMSRDARRVCTLTIGPVIAQRSLPRSTAVRPCLNTRYGRHRILPIIRGPTPVPLLTHISAHALSAIIPGVLDHLFQGLHILRQGLQLPFGILFETFSKPFPMTRTSVPSPSKQQPKPST